jgi:hypothetical protein
MFCLIDCVVACDCAMRDIWFLFLTRLAGNRIGDEGARMLAEPLGKLTALQQLSLSGTVSACFA